MEIEGKVAVVSGGGSGIGRALATALATAVASVVVGEVLDPDEVAELTLNAVRENRFMVTPYPQVLDMYRLKGADYDGWIAGMRRYSMRAGLPEAWTSADKTGTGDYGSTNDIGIAYGPDGRKVLLGIMTRSAADDPKAQALRPVIGELTTQVVGSLISPS